MLMPVGNDHSLHGLAERIHKGLEFVVLRSVAGHVEHHQPIAFHHLGRSPRGRYIIMQRDLSRRPADHLPVSKRKPGRLSRTGNTQYGKSRSGNEKSVHIFLP